MLKDRLKRAEAMLRESTPAYRIAFIDLDYAEAHPGEFEAFLAHCVEAGLVVTHILGVCADGSVRRAHTAGAHGDESRKVAGITFWGRPGASGYRIPDKLHFPGGFDELLEQNVVELLADTFAPN